MSDFLPFRAFIWFQLPRELQLIAASSHKIFYAGISGLLQHYVGDWTTSVVRP